MTQQRSELFKRVQALYVRQKKEAVARGKLSDAEPFEVHELSLGRRRSIFYLRPTNSFQEVTYVVQKGKVHVRITEAGVQNADNVPAAEDMIKQVLDDYDG